MLGLLILLLLFFLGEGLHRYTHVPLPGNVIGLLLLLLALSLGLVKLAWVENAAGFLLRHMMLLFAPVIVIGTLAMTRENWLPIAAIIILSTLATLLATAAVASLFTEKPEQASQEDVDQKSASQEEPRA